VTGGAPREGPAKARGAPGLVRYLPGVTHHESPGCGWVLRVACVLLTPLAVAPVIAAGPGTADAQQPPPAETAAPEPAPPETIPLPEIAARADETTRRLREIREAARPSPQVEEIAAQLEERSARLAEARERTEDLLAEGAGIDRLQDARQTWMGIGDELARWRTTPTKRAMALEVRAQDLAAMRGRWQATLEQAREADAPADLVARIQGVLEEIDAAEAVLTERRNQALGLQNRIAQQEVVVGDVLAGLAEELGERRGALLERDRPALWAALSSATRSDLLPDPATGLLADLRRSRAFFARRAENLAAQGLALLVVLGLLLHMRRLAGRWEADDPRRSCAAIWERPVSTTLVLGILAHTWFHPHSPAVIRDLAGLVVLVPLLRLLPQLLPFAPRSLLIALAAFYLTDQIRGLMGPALLGERLIFLGETAVAAGLVGTLLRPSRLARLPQGTRLPGVLPFLMRVAAAALAISTLANALGFVGLAELLGEGTLRSTYAAVLFAGGLYIVRDLFRLLLSSGWSARLRMVRRHRPLLLRRGLRGLELAFLALWVLFALEQFAMRQVAGDLLGDALGASLSVGTVSISLGDLVAFGVTVVAAIWIARTLTFVLDEDVFPRLRLQRGVPHAISASTRYVILLGGFFLAVAAAGVDLQRFTILAGALGVGIGFGLQNVVNNFVSGLILLYERPVQVGDAIELPELFGEVRRIGIRASTVRTWDGAEVIVPNGDLISTRVTNWTLSDRQRRMILRVGVAYGTEPERVLEILLRVAREHPNILDAPAPFARFAGFGDSSLDFELWAFVPRFEIFWPTQNDLLLSIHAALREAGITIPFPQRDLHLRSADAADFGLLAGEHSGRPPAEAATAEEPIRENREDSPQSPQRAQRGRS